MGYEQVCREDGFTERERWVFTFSVEGDLRFISHRDTLRMFQRAFARASLPVRYSQGFNPHARLSIPLPRPVGVASRAEAIIVEFQETIDGDDARRRLGQRLPESIRIDDARRLGPGERLVPVLVRYRLDRDEPRDSGLAARVHQLLHSSVIVVTRMNPKEKEPCSIDIRSFIVDIQVEDNAVEFTLRVTDRGSAKPAEIVELLGFDAGSVCHRIRRVEVQWHDNDR